MNPDDDKIALHRDQILGHLSDLTGEAIDSEDPQHVARVLGCLDKILERVNGKRGVIGHVGEVEAHLIACLDGRAEVSVTSGGVRFHKSFSKPRKGWRWDELTSSLLPAIRNAPRLLSPSGEVEDDTARAVRLIRDAVGWSAGKVGGLRDLGLSADEFCETGVAKVTVERFAADPTTSEAY